MSTPAGDGHIGDATITVNANTTAAALAIRGLARDANGNLRDMRGRFVSESATMTRAIGGVTGALSGGGSGGGIGLNPAMMGVAAVAGTSLLPALGALSPILFGVAAAGGAAGLAMGAIKEEAKKLKPQFEELQKVAEKAVMPGVAKGFKDIQGAMKSLHPVIRIGGEAFGDFVAEAGAFAKSPAFQGALLKNVQMGSGFFREFGGSVLKLTQSFLDFGTKSKASMDALGGGLSGLIGQGLPGMFKGLERGIQGSSQFLDGFFDTLNVKLLPAFGRLAGEMGRSLGPVFGETIRLMGTMTAGAMDLLGGGLKLLSPVFKDVAFGVKAVNQVLMLTAPIIKGTASAIFGALLPSFAEVDKARGPFQRLAAAVERNKLEIQQHVLSIGNVIIDMVTVGISALPTLVGGFRVMTGGILVALQAIVDGAASAFSWIPGIGGKLKGASEAFGRFKDGWMGGLAAAEGATRAFANNVTPKLQQNKLNLNISTWTSMIATAEKEMNATTSKERKAKLKLDIEQLKAQRKEAQRQLDMLDGQVATVYVKVVTSKIPNLYGPGLGTALATGGPVRGPGTSTSDSIPAMLSDGEFVVRAAAVRRYGEGTFAALNALQTPLRALGRGGVPAASLDVGSTRAAPVVNVTNTYRFELTNRGVIGSEREMENWLSKALEHLRLQGRMP